MNPSAGSVRRVSERGEDRLFAACGIASVVLVVAGAIVGSAGGQPSYTLDSTPARVARELANPAGPVAWAGAYIELLSVGFFLAFAVWACTKLGGGLLGALGRAAAVVYAALSVAALGVADALAYRAGHGIRADVGTVLANTSSALFVASWILSAFLLLAVGTLALNSGRRFLGWSAIGIAAVTLVATPALVERGGQIGYFLWLAWIVVASIALARDERAPGMAVAVA
jgi:hypothetical protein